MDLAAMGRKSSTDALGKCTAASAKSSKPSSSSSSFAVGAAGTKRSNLSASVLLANMDKPKPRSRAPPTDSYTSGMDLPPSDSDDDIDAVMINKPRHRSVADLAVVAPSRKELKKREMKDQQAACTAGLSRRDAIRDDRDAFNVVIGGRSTTLKAGNESPAADANAKDITIESFSVSARGKELLKNASLKVSHGKRYGVVGPSGMGKSTLLKLLAWRKIPVPQNNDVLLVEEEVVGDDRSVLEVVVAANEDLVLLREEAAAINGTGDDGESGDRLTDVYQELHLVGSDAAEAQASKILAGLGFTTEMQGRATKWFSGGWRMRISLAQALFVQPTLLLLDEPTNHLDLRAVLWLQEYLCGWKKTLVVVSHDRDFLNVVCGKIIHLHDLKLHFYRGNLDDFKGGYEQKQKEMNKQYENYGKQMMKTVKRTGTKFQIDTINYLVGRERLMWKG